MRRPYLLKLIMFDPKIRSRSMILNFRVICYALAIELTWIPYAEFRAISSGVVFHLDVPDRHSLGEIKSFWQVEEAGAKSVWG